MSVRVPNNGQVVKIRTALKYDRKLLGWKIEIPNNRKYHKRKSAETACAAEGVYRENFRRFIIEDNTDPKNVVYYLAELVPAVIKLNW